jgi:hypothetical protein
MANMNVGGLIKDADAAITEKAKAVDRVAALRDILRLAVRAKEATKEQADWIESAFPSRERKTAEERVQELERQLAKASSKLDENGDGE